MCPHGKWDLFDAQQQVWPDPLASGGHLPKLPFLTPSITHTGDSGKRSQASFSG